MKIINQKSTKINSIKNIITKIYFYSLIISTIFINYSLESKPNNKENKDKSEQKKKFTFEDAMKFKSIKKTVLSEDGKWLVYNVSPDRGDGYLVIKNLLDTSSKEIKIERGDNQQISLYNNQLAFNKLPKFIDIENSKSDKDKPKNDLILMDLENGKSEEIIQSNNFSLSNDGKWLVYKTYPEKKPDDKSNDKSKRIIGENLYLRNIKSKSEILIRDVSDYLIDSTSQFIIYAVATNNGKNNGVFFRELLKDYAPETIIKQDSNFYFGNLNWNIQSQKLVFLTGILDSASSKPKNQSIIMTDFKNNLETSVLVNNNIINNWFIPNVNKIEFTKNGNLLYFGIKLESDNVPEKDDKADKKKIKEEDLYNMDKIADDAQMFTWHYNDPKIVTQQKIDWKQKKDRTFFAVINTNDKKLNYDTLIESTNIINNENEDFIILTDDKPYLKEISYKGWYFDAYSYNLKNGNKNLIKKYLNHNPNLSPNGDYVSFYDMKNWYFYDNKSNTTNELSSKLNLPFYDLDNDVPKEPDPYGFAGWYKDNSLVYGLFYDEFDIWKINTNTFETENLTNQIGRSNKIKLRITYKDKNKEYLTNMDTLLLSGFNKINKANNLLSLDLKSKMIINEFKDDKNFAFRQKPDFSNKFLYTKQSFEEFPDYWITDFSLSNPQKVSDVNPEMKNYIWGKSHLLKWANSKGDSLDGYYILPDNYNPNKKYPVVIYFYEQMSQDKNRFIQPSNLHRPCFQVYLGDEYVIFLPDVKYYNPYPGQSSLDALVSGSRKLAEIGVADSNKIGIWGHSWSGYQGAYIVTQTNFFKACVSGAPVGNMTSAYSGIRLSSGLARQFQYEQQQSRIGGNLIDSLDRYIENSPVFYADKMNTPTLIMFGDEDDAVPYPQGIELYMAFRRYNKPAIMLQYEGEPHHLKKYPNKVDYTIKMKEFYDHYLLGKPAPDWLTKGVEYKGTYTR